MQENREASIDWIIKQECEPGEEMTGSYHNDPADPGGETKFGIAKSSHPDVDIANLTRNDAIEIYSNDYWTPINGDDLLAGIDLVVLDFAVTSGTKRSLQYYNLTTQRVGTDDTKKLIQTFTDLRDDFYRKLPLKNPKLIKFVPWWTKRADKSCTLALTMVS